MDAALLAGLGLLIILVVIIDQLATILGAGNGSGFVTPRLHRRLWWGALRVHRRWPMDRGLAALGPSLLLFGPVLWISGLWLGWSLVFMADPQAVLDGTSGAPATGNGRGYFVGFSVSTLGVGDLVPGPGVWRVASVVAALMGLTMITLSITYLVPVVQAANDRRRAARTIRNTLRVLGDRPTGHGAGSTEGDAAVESLVSLRDGFDSVAEQHHTYHVLRYFRAPSADRSLPVQVDLALDWFEQRSVDAMTSEKLLEVTLRSLAESIVENAPGERGLHESLRAIDGR